MNPDEAIERVVQTIREKYQPEKIILFGSRVWGKPDADSDLDVLIIKKSRKREVTLEYVLLAGVNDTNVCADALAKIARRLRCNVNLIRYNQPDCPEHTFTSPTQVTIKAFAQRLQGKGVNVHVRQSRGLDASAACGQLRRRAIQ